MYPHCYRTIRTTFQRAPTLLHVFVFRPDLKFNCTDQLMLFLLLLWRDARSLAQVAADNGSLVSVWPWTWLRRGLFIGRPPFIVYRKYSIMTIWCILRISYFDCQNCGHEMIVFRKMMLLLIETFVRCLSSSLSGIPVRIRYTGRVTNVYQISAFSPRIDSRVWCNDVIPYDTCTYSL